MRIWGGFGYNRKSVSSNGRQTFSHKSGVLYKTAGRTSNSHNLIECRYMPDSDKEALGWSRLVTNDACDEGEVDLCDDDEPENVISDHSARLVECGLSSRRVNVVQSPVLYTFCQHHPVALTLDTGVTTNMIRALTARLYHLPIKPASQIARHADDVTPLDVTGEVYCNVTRGHLSFQLHWLSSNLMSMFWKGILSQ